ncbi:hypothetical protein HJC23_002592 [Cyclotella cryptica]|uniref:Acyltransferase n=1 Tax=Cyclotella cryptica TaxID=29204 RepID=A0ABD3PXN7_9STRA|eukprot:CCRYP_010345-RA/>CCRYP_010345-RA protein AED:0.25 eAED:0.25 QI:193/1/1/1/1/1/4/350/406
MDQAKPGHTVRFQGLTETPHLNGTTGTLEFHHADMERWSVRCHIDEQVVNAKVENLTLVSSNAISKRESTASSGSNASDSSKWKTQETPQDCGFIPTLAVTLWLGWNGIILLILLYGVFIAARWERMVIIGLCVASLILPAEFPGRIGFLLGNWMMKGAEKYFGLKTVIEDEGNLLSHARRNKACIFAFNPHDMLPYAVFAFSPALRRLPGKLGEDGCCLMTSAIFNVPFLRQVYSWVKSLPVDKRTFMGRLKRGESFAFVPGGVQEVILLDPKKPDDVVLFLRNRKGFIKLALSTGSPIVPVFGFNLDGSYGYWFPRHPFIEKLSRTIGFLPLVFWGRWFVPFGIPKPKRIHVVIGPAIDVPNMGDVLDQEVVDKYHSIFLKELEALFERHKHDAGYGERTLKIV